MPPWLWRDGKARVPSPDQDRTPQKAFTTRTGGSQNRLIGCRFKAQVDDRMATYIAWTQPGDRHTGDLSTSDLSTSDLKRTGTDPIVGPGEPDQGEQQPWWTTTKVDDNQ